MRSRSWGKPASGRSLRTRSLMAGSISAEMRKGVERRAMAVPPAGHLFTDINQGAVAALIPFLVAERGLSLAAAGSLVLAAPLSSSLVPPPFGSFPAHR